MYYFPYGQLLSYLYPTTVNLSPTQTKAYTTSSTSSLIYVSAPEADHKWCSAGSCVTAKSAAYAGTGQSFFTVYYGNYYYNNKVGAINFGIPPSTMQVL